MSERLGSFVQKELRAQLAAAYEKVRTLRAKQRAQRARHDVIQAALPTMRGELTKLQEAINAAHVQRVRGEADTLAAAKERYAAQAERIADAVAEMAALRQVEMDRSEALDLEEAARMAREQFIKSVIENIRTTLQADSRLRERVELLYATLHSPADSTIGEAREPFLWPQALADAIGVNPDVYCVLNGVNPDAKEHERILAKYAAELPERL